MHNKALSVETTWRFRNSDGEELDPLLFRLLSLIRRSGRLTVAASESGYSYRHCWNLIQRWSGFFGMPLVHLEQGRGAMLTELGERLYWSSCRIQARVEPELANIAAEVDAELRLALAKERPSVVLHACHGYAVALLPELLAQQAGVNTALRFLGSLDALASMAAGECDFCGFRLPESPFGDTLAARSWRSLGDGDFRFVRMVGRTQGLFLAPGNPLGITGIRDLAREKVRFVNRPIHSGTRLLFDELLADEGMDPDQVTGYARVELTHMAVAACVAGGLADAGLGVQAAAAGMDLDFVPLVQEAYLLGCRSEILSRPGGRALLDVLHDAAFSRQVDALPGYSAAGAGTVFSCAEVFRS